MQTPSALSGDFLQAALHAPPERRAAALKVLLGKSASQQTSSGPLFVTGTQSAKLLGISRTTFRRWAREARLKRVEILPHRFRFKREDILALAQNAGGAA